MPIADLGPREDRKGKSQGTCGCFDVPVMAYFMAFLTVALIVFGCVRSYLVSRPQLSEQGSDVVAFRWVGPDGADLCLEVANLGVSAAVEYSATLDAATCKPRAIGQLFVAFAHSPWGEVRWAGNQSLCLEALGAFQSIVLRECGAGSDGGSVLLLPASSQAGPIRLEPRRKLGRRQSAAGAMDRGGCFWLSRDAQPGDGVFLSSCSDSLDLGLGSTSHSNFLVYSTQAPLPHAIPVEAAASRPSGSLRSPEGLALLMSVVHPGKCLDVRGGGVQNGNGLQLWDCSDHGDMHFLTPANGESGQIRWASHPEKCLDARDTGGVFLWDCDEKNLNVNMQFVMPQDASGPIRLVTNPDRCWGLDSNSAQNGHSFLIVVPCTSYSGFEAHHFSQEAKTKVSTQRAVITWEAKHRHQCLDVQAGSIRSGNGLQIWSCNNQMQFLTPPNGGTGQIRLAHHPDICLDSRKVGNIFLWKCAENGKNPHMDFVMPEGGSGPIRLATNRNLCLYRGINQHHLSEKPPLLTVGPCREQSRTSLTVLPVQCAFGDWSAFSACSVKTCGESGVRTRSRPAALAWEWSPGDQEGQGNFQVAKTCQEAARQELACQAPPCPSSKSKASQSSNDSLPVPDVQL